ncbi:hypothetical protein [Nitrosomonas marina]|uniref:Uncharacterized protein n=1 Tax=Nitrosomonas marina TaxID=917 RepID=A0A1H8AMW5_9PROT|nr:hypothetical protein [Nitrosomonas marina]SEM72001.1 hypothetical protein SAMN05216325_101236 [Nitrosomonas marina]
MQQQNANNKAFVRISKENSFLQSVPSITLIEGGDEICGINGKSAANQDIDTGSMFMLIAMGSVRSCSGLQLSIFSNHETVNSRMTVCVRA